MRIILIRHCKTLFNVSGRIMGWSDSPQAEGWREDAVYIEREIMSREQVPALVYTSDLERARLTGDYLGREFDRKVLHSQQLNEINYGDLAEKSKNWVAVNFPLHKKDPDFVYPGGESFRGMQHRVVRFVTGLVEKHAGQTLLCVAHAGVVRALVSYFLQLDFAAQLRRGIPHRYIGVFSFDSSLCGGYDEWGEPSGFVSDKVITLPSNIESVQ